MEEIDDEVLEDFAKHVKDTYTDPILIDMLDRGITGEVDTITLDTEH